MKKIHLLALAFCCVAIVSCSSQQARKFNDQLVTIKNDVVTNTDMLMKGPDKKENTIKAGAFIKQKLGELEKVEAVKGGEALKQAMIDDIKALSMIYDIAVKLNNPDLSQEEGTELEREQQELLNKIPAYDQAVNLEQQKFAKEKGLKIENK